MEDMDRVFNSKTGEEDARLLREAQNEVGLTAFLASVGQTPESTAQRDIRAKEGGGNEQLVEKI